MAGCPEQVTTAPGAPVILAAPENEIERIRPKALARAWGIAVRDAVELCLAARDSCRTGAFVDATSPVGLAGAGAPR